MNNGKDEEHEQSSGLPFNNSARPGQCTPSPRRFNTTSTTVVRSSETKTVPLERKKTVYDLATLQQLSKSDASKSSGSVPTVESDVGSVLPRNTFDYRSTSSSSGSSLRQKGKHHQSRNLGLNRRKAWPLSNNVVNTSSGFKVPFKRGGSYTVWGTAGREEAKRKGLRLSSSLYNGRKMHKGARYDTTWDDDAELEEDDGFSNTDSDLEPGEEDLDDASGEPWEDLGDD